MTLCQKHTHFCRQLLVPPFVKQISQLFRKLYFRIHDPLCFARLGVPLVSNPILRSFPAHSHANNFANPANPVLTPWFILLFKYGGRESWGVGGGVGEDLSLTRTSSPPNPPKSIHLNPFHYTATKSSFTPLEITTGQDKIYGHAAHSALGPC